MWYNICSEKTLAAYLLWLWISLESRQVLYHSTAYDSRARCRAWLLLHLLLSAYPLLGAYLLTTYACKHMHLLTRIYHIYGKIIPTCETIKVKQTICKCFICTRQCKKLIRHDIHVHTLPFWMRPPLSGCKLLLVSPVSLLESLEPSIKPKLPDLSCSFGEKFNKWI